MKKVYYLFAALAAGFAFTSCGDDPVLEPDPVGTTYPRVQLIEHFTGEACGYCPGGMDAIYEVYSKDQENIVWVSNHYGFGNDEYSIKGSTTIGKKLGVQGAPQISINRYQYTNASEGLNKAKSYHPYFTSAVMKKQEKTATSCVELERTYDAATRNLHVKATIKTADAELAGVFLTLGVTESGPVGEQHDYENSWEGWEEFTHTHIIRVYATEALGDEYVFTNRLAVAEYDIPMDAEWVADNCEIVAWITANTGYMPVLNAAKLPVVEGTKGGEDIKHGGVKAVAVPDSYPEQGTVAESVTFNDFDVQITNQGGITIASLVLVSDQVVGRDSQYGNLYPYLQLYLCMPLSDNVAYGTYQVSADMTAGTIVAGIRDDVNFSLDGSQILYVFSYNNKLYIGKQWLVNSGSLTITAEGITGDLTTRNGSTMHVVFNGDINNAAAAGVAPRRMNNWLMKMLGEPMNVLYF